MTSLLARIKIVPQKLVNVGSLVRMKKKACGAWPTYHACTCLPTDLAKDAGGYYHLFDFKKSPKWCGPQERFAIGMSDPTKRVNIGPESTGLVVDCAYWHERPLWVILFHEAFICVDEEHLLIL